MKSYITITAILLVLILSSVMFPKQTSAQEANVSFQVFYDQLSPYGQWVNYLNYGYVWIPDAGSDFVPYSTGGHWLLTDVGWTWVSDYNWGWAPFHYGRWSHSNSFGWFWVPDNVWGPSWVTWRRADGYYGWEPMEPGLSINLSFGRAYDNHNDNWQFVRDRDIERSDINHYYINRTDHERIIRNSTVINKTYIDNSRHTTYISGPAREEVQRVTGRKVTPVVIQENDKPGQVLSNGQLRIYRPQIKINNDTKQKPVPSKIANLNNLKRPSESSTTNQQRNVNPQNINNKVQPLQPQKSNSLENNGKEQKQNTAKTQNQNNKVKSSQPGNIIPKVDKGIVSQQKNMNLQNKNDKIQPLQSQKSNTLENNGKEQKPNTVKTQNQNDKVKSSQSGNVIPKVDKGSNDQHKNMNQQNKNDKIQPLNSKKSNPLKNNLREQKPETKTTKDIDNKEQIKDDKPELNKK